MASKTQARLQAQAAKRRTREARQAKRTGTELGFKPSFVLGRWQRTPPSERGVYPVVSREGGLWTGAIALHSQTWRGWWWSERIASGRDFTRLPPAPPWDGETDAQTATAADVRPHPERTRSAER